MHRTPSRPMLCALVTLLAIVGIFLLAACAARPAVWEHFTDPWPNYEPLHEDQPALCEDYCTV